MTIKQEQIVATGKNLFFKHGVKRISVEEICKIASVSKVTFYKYFTNKLSLVKVIRDKLVDEGFSQFDFICDQEIPYVEKIREMTKWKVNFFSQMSSEFIEDIISLKDIREKIKTRYLRNIKNAQEKGEIKKEFSPELIWLVTEKLNEIGTDGTWKSIFLDYGEYQKQMRDLFFTGLLNDEK